MLLTALLKPFIHNTCSVNQHCLIFLKKFIQLPFRQFFEIDRFHLMRFKRTIPLTSAQKDFTSVANCENKIVCFLKLKHLLLRYKKIALFHKCYLNSFKNLIFKAISVLPFQRSSIQYRRVLK